MTMGSRVAVMRKGELQQVAPPREIYEQPANLFVATFIGSPSMNLVQGIVLRGDAGLSCRIGDQELALPSEAVSPGLAGYAGRPVAVGIRPEHLREAETQNGAGRDRLRAAVTATEILGSDLLVHAEIEAEPVVTDEVLEVAADVDVTALSELQEEAKRRRVPLLGRFDPASRVEAGDTVEVAVDPARLHFFDLETEAAIG
jgi:multiple sugar transport system ATP-binding protein